MTDETPNYKAMQSADMLNELNDDGSKWADAFLQHYPDCGVEWDMLMGWFANSIEHSNDYRAGRVHNGDHAQYLIDRAARVASEKETSKADEGILDHVSTGIQWVERRRAADIIRSWKKPHVSYEVFDTSAILELAAVEVEEIDLPPL